MKRMENLVTVVTAGGQPISRGIAVRYAAEGARVYIVDCDCEAGEAAAMEAGSNARFLEADICQRQAARKVMDAVGEEHGRIDALVIGGEDAPGADSWAPLESKTAEDFNRALANDVYGALWALQAALPWMQTRGGSIITLFSPFGEYASRYVGEHMTARWGLLGLARTAGHEWGRYQIRVNTLVPLADTPAFRSYRERDLAAVEQRVQQTALKRVGDPVRDIGGAAVFLATDDTRFLTGQIVYADGGSFMTTPVFEPVWTA